MSIRCLPLVSFFFSWLVWLCDEHLEHVVSLYHQFDELQIARRRVARWPLK